MTIHATGSSFTAMKADGTVRSWGRGIEQSKVPSIAFERIYSSGNSFAGINPSGTYECITLLNVRVSRVRARVCVGVCL